VGKSQNVSSKKGRKTKTAELLNTQNGQTQGPGTGGRLMGNGKKERKKRGKGAPGFEQGSRCRINCEPEAKQKARQKKRCFYKGEEGRGHEHPARITTWPRHRMVENLM